MIAGKATLRAALISLALFGAVAEPMLARTLMTREQALASAFPPPQNVVRQKFFLTPQQLADARHESGVDFGDALIVRYAATGSSTGGSFAYFDTHRVRTLPETIMVVVKADGSVERVDILSFDEPTDYFPKRRWVDQLLGRKLDRELALDRAVRPLSGASLTGRAIVNATRKVLALHHVLTGVAPR